MAAPSTMDMTEYAHQRNQLAARLQEENERRVTNQRRVRRDAKDAVDREHKRFVDSRATIMEKWQELERRRLKGMPRLCSSPECIHVAATPQDVTHVCVICHHRFCAYCVNHQQEPNYSCGGCCSNPSSWRGFNLGSGGGAGGVGCCGVLLVFIVAIAMFATIGFLIEGLLSAIHRSCRRCRARIQPRYQFHRQCRSCEAMAPRTDLACVDVIWKDDSVLLPPLPETPRPHDSSSRSRSCCDSDSSDSDS